MKESILVSEINKLQIIASVPVQQWKEVYDEEQAFSNGTIFPELDKPFFVTVQDSKLEKGPKRILRQSKRPEQFMTTCYTHYIFGQHNSRGYNGLNSI